MSIVVNKRHVVYFAAALLVIAVLSLVLSGAFFVSGADSTSDSTVQKLEDSLEKATAAREEAAAALSAAQSDQFDAIRTKNAIDADLKAQENVLTIMRSLVDEYGVEIEAAEAEIKELQVKADEKYQTFIEHLQYTYENGNVGYLEILLTSQGLREFFTNLDMVTQVLELDRAIIADYEQSAAELETEKQTLIAEQAAYSKRADELDAKTDELEASLAESKQFITTLNSDVIKAEAAYNKAIAAEEELQNAIAARLAESQKKTNSIYVGGDLMWPLANYTFVSSGFGPRKHPVTGADQIHLGVDIPAPYGTQILAANDGTVIEVDYHYANGNYVIVDHGGGTATFYAHLSKFNVKAGDVVSQGDVIGYVGATGFATGNHLHFSVYVNSEAVDPMKYFTAS